MLHATRTEASRLRPAEHVRWAVLGDVIIVLDLRREAYYAMNQAGASMWQLLARGLERPRILAELGRAYPGAEERLSGDLDQFVQRCRGDGLLVESREQPRLGERSAVPIRKTPARRFLLLRAWWCLVSCAHRLGRRGFGDAYAHAEALAMARLEGRPELAVSSALRIFRTAENFLALRGAPRDCMPRSLALFCFLRTLGISAEHCIGIRHYPFSAHAWVEFEGDALLNERGLAGDYEVIARIGA